MHIMEDVREACDVQPSSPGHAEHGPDLTTTCKENGYSKEADSKSKNQDQPRKDQAEAAKDGDGESNLENSKQSENDPSIIKEIKLENGTSHAEDDSSDSGDGKASKRKLDMEESSTVKKLKGEIHENFLLRDRILNEYIDLGDCSSLEQMHTYTEQILAEIKTLNDLAKEKEREWNNIIHLKKLKEELLLRIQRRKQIMVLNGDKTDLDMSLTESQLDLLDERLTTMTNNNTPPGQSVLKSNLNKGNSSTLKIPNINSEKADKNKQRSLLATTLEMNGQSNDYKTRQRPILDVQSIIADFRQRHPEAVPRRGRRIRSVLNPQGDGLGSNGRMNSGSVLNFSSLALGSGAQVRQNVGGGYDVNSELGLLLSAMEGVSLSVVIPIIVKKFSMTL